MRVALALLALLLTAPWPAVPAQTAGLGVTPSELRWVDPPALRDVLYVRTLMASNPSAQSLNVTATPEGDVAPWLAADPSTFPLAPGEERTLEVRLRVPANATLGEHAGGLHFVGRQTDPGQGTPVEPTVTVPVRVRVGEAEHLELVVDGLRGDHVVRGEPFRAFLNVQNTGNLPASYTLRVRIFDSDRNATLLDAVLYGSTLDPGGNRSDEHPVAIDLPRGPYVYNLTVTLNGTAQTLARAERVFAVYEAGEAPVAGELLAVEAPLTASWGATVEVVARFRNTGLVPIDGARFVGEVTHAGGVVATLAAAPQDVAPGQTVVFRVPFRAEASGRLEAGGHVEYAGLRTEERTSIVTVPAEGMPRWAVWAGMALGLLFLLAGAVGLVRRIRDASDQDRRRPLGPLRVRPPRERPPKGPPPRPPGTN